MDKTMQPKQRFKSITILLFFLSISALFQSSSAFEICKNHKCKNGASCVPLSKEEYRCECSDGFEGHTCDQPKSKSMNPCNPNPCKQKSQCRVTDRGLNFRCDCAVGWSGKLCDTNVDDCASNPCLHNGECIDQINSRYICKCPKGFTGYRCQHKNPCDSNPCINGGRCNLTFKPGQDKPVSTCRCPNGFTGIYCEQDKNECSSYNFCKHGGQCVNVLGSYRCKCKTGYSGDRCENQIDECKIKPCQNNGTCYDKVGFYLCVCPPNFSGKNCENRLPSCFNKPCGNHGTCLEKLGGGYKCNCSSGYEGDKCQYEINPCKLKITPCKNGGECKTTGSNYRCECKPGFKGKHCNEAVDDCKDVVCQNNGKCIDRLNSAKCECKPGFHGRYCEHITDPCTRNPCKHGGKCTSNLLPKVQYKCHCVMNYGGTNCEVDYTLCAKKPCKNGGQCKVINGERVCYCRNGFVGLDCERNGQNDPCAQLTSQCHGGTVCEIDGSPRGYRCVCPAGSFCTDKDTSQTIQSNCKSLRCEHGGICKLDSNSNEICVCPSLYSGKRCQTKVVDCLKNPCQHGATCLSHKDGYRCECKAGYKGKNCEINIDDCQSNPCGINGVCTDLVNGFRCKCRKPYSGTRCTELLQPCKHRKCENDAMCIPEKSYLKSSCNCTTAFGRFSGETCGHDVDECRLTRYQMINYGFWLGDKQHKFSYDQSSKIMNPCVNNGTCINTIGSFVCRCPAGFEGNQCEINIDDCASKPCKNGGTCVDEIDNYKCICPAGFNGINCENDIDECASNPCKNGAKCLDHVNMYQCICPLGFSGENCQINDNDCTPSSCTGAGKCIDMVNGYRCECNKGFYGKYCEHRTHPCDMKPCQNNGTCVNRKTNKYIASDYECQCRLGFTGPHCEQAMQWCRGNPCGDQGKCKVTDGSFQCLCNHGYYGEKCELKVGETCQQYSLRQYGNPNKTHQICQFGECIDRAGKIGFKCYCKPNYRGTFCQHKIDFCAAQPCQNGATCINHNSSYSCDCVPGFYGIKCQTNRDDCATNPCKYGKCIDKINDFACICPPHITGKICDTVEDMCIKVACLNGGKCESTIGGFTCKCAKGFSGQKCEININECRYSPAILEQALINNINYNSSNPSVSSSLMSKLSSLGPCSPIGTKACVDQVGGYKCECNDGWTGKRCETRIDSDSTHVRSFCDYKGCSRVGKCVNKPDSPNRFECQCPNGYGGEKCQYYSKKCSSDTCKNDGVCRPKLNNLNSIVGYYCQCPRGVGGLHCEVNLANSCAAWKQMKRENYCYNGGFCSDSTDKPKCNCQQGFCGSRCEISDPRKCKGIPYDVELDICSKNKCHLKRNNKRCDHECNLLACDFDGDECLYKVPHLVEKKNVKLAKPWSSCSVIKTKNIPCQHMFMNGVCNPECNSEECLLDGWDCATKSKIKECPHKEYCRLRFEDGKCDEICNTLECNYDGGDCDPDNNKPGSDKTVASKTKVNGTMILILPVSTKKFVRIYEHELIESLSKLLHLFVRVERSKTGQKKIYAVRVFEDKTAIRAKRSVNDKDEGKPGTKVYLELDNRYCKGKGGSCINNINSAVEFVSASLYTKHFDPPVSILSVQSKIRGSDGRGKGLPWTNNIFVYAMMAIFAFFVSVSALGVLYGFTQKKEKNQKAKAEIWFPEGMKRTIRNERKLNINNVLNSRKRSANNSNPITNNLNDIGLNDSSVEDNNSGGSHSLTSTRLTNYEPGATSTNSGTVTQTTQLCTNAPNFDTTQPQQQQQQQAIMTSSYHHACTTPLLNNQHTSNFPLSNSHHQFGVISRGGTPNITSRNTYVAPGDLSMSASQASLLLNDAANNATAYVNYPPEKRIKLNQMNDFSNTTHDLETKCFNAIASALVSGSGLGDLTIQEAHNSQMILEQILKSVAKQAYFQYTQNPHNHHPHTYFLNNHHHIHSNNLPLNYHSNYQMNELHKMDLPNNLLLSIVTRTTEDKGETLLHLAAKFNRHEATKILLEAGSDPNMVDNSNRNVFMVAVNAGAFEVARELLIQQKFPIDLQSRGPGGTTCLMEAIKHAHNEIIELILYNTQPEECDLNITDEHGRTALHWASATDQPHTVQCLLRLGFNRDAQDAHDRTPLFVAAIEGCYEVAHVLLLHGANPDMGDHMDQLPVDIARKSDYADIVQLLEQHAQLTKESASLVHPHHPHHPIAVSSMLNHHSGAISANFGGPVFMNGGGAPANSSQIFANQNSHHQAVAFPQLSNHRHQPMFPPTTSHNNNNNNNNNSSSWHSPNSTNSYFSNPTYATHTSPPQNSAGPPIFPPYTQDSAVSKQQPPPVPSHNSQRATTTTTNTTSAASKTNIHYLPPSNKFNPLLSPSYIKNTNPAKSVVDSDKAVAPQNPLVNGLTPSTDSESPGHWSTSSPSLSPRSRNQLNTTLQQKNVLNSHNIPHSNFIHQQQPQQLHIQSTNPSNNCGVENSKNHTPPTAPQSSSSTSSVLHYHPSPTYEQQKFASQNHLQSRNNIQLPQPQPTPQNPAQQHIPLYNYTS